MDGSSKPRAAEIVDANTPEAQATSEGVKIGSAIGCESTGDDAEVVRIERKLLCPYPAVVLGSVRERGAAKRREVFRTSW